MKYVTVLVKNLVHRKLLMIIFPTQSKAYTRVVTPTQFSRILHFLGLNLNSNDLKLILTKFQDPATGDVNYPAFVQAVDRGSSIKYLFI